MNRKFFGTDGIRGIANTPPMTADIALKVGMATGAYFRKVDKDVKDHKVVIGKDTRLSGYMIEPALTAGFVAMGMNVVLVGPLPTPAVAMLTRSFRADLGVMISASHNHYQDNGIKLFDGIGLKLSDEVEHKIEALMQSDMHKLLAKPDELGRAKRLDDAQGRYIQHVKNTFPRRKSLEGLKIVLDCANGAAYKIAPPVFWELGAEVVTLNANPNGFNINANCGSTSPQNMCAEVIKQKADIGIALDGDADRIVVCDEKGKLIDGDQILALIARHQEELGALQGGGVVATAMSNMGLEHYLESIDLHLIRTEVGDRYVSRFMRENGYNVGGEQSGHIILRDHATTGDGLIAALQILAVLVDSDKPASKVCRVFKPYPQLLKSVTYTSKDPLEDKEVKAVIKSGTVLLGDKGRVVIRKSGTEPLVRVMAECQDEKLIVRVVDSIIKAVRKAS
jgi:phosphoglucosamine mutase